MFCLLPVDGNLVLQNINFHSFCFSFVCCLNLRQSFISLTLACISFQAWLNIHVLVFMFHTIKEQTHQDSILLNMYHYFPLKPLSTSSHPHLQ